MGADDKRTQSMSKMIVKQWRDSSLVLVAIIIVFSFLFSTVL